MKAVTPRTQRRRLGMCRHLLLAAIPAVAQNQCSLGMTMNCTNGVCTAVTTNTGSNMCTAEYIVAILIDDPQSRGTVTGFSTSLGLSGQECFDSSTFPIGFGPHRGWLPHRRRSGDLTNALITRAPT